MTETIVVVDTSEIFEGKAPEVERAVKELVEFVEATEARPIAYSVYLDEERTRMTVVQVHPDSASMEYHLVVAAHVFRGFAGLIRLMSMDLYGRPGGRLLRQIRQKVEVLGNATVAVHELHAGLDRFGARAASSGMGPSETASPA